MAFRTRMTMKNITASMMIEFMKILETLIGRYEVSFYKEVDILVNFYLSNCFFQ